MNYQRFRKNVNNFLIEVRGFLRTIWFVAPLCKCKQNILVFLILCIVFTWTRFWNRKENPSSNSRYSQFLVVSRVKLKLFLMNEIEVETLVQAQGSENDGFWVKRRLGSYISSFLSVSCCSKIIPDCMNNSKLVTLC
jgi:hypothetical protein